MGKPEVLAEIQDLLNYAEVRSWGDDREGRRVIKGLRFARMLYNDGDVEWAEDMVERLKQRHPPINR